MAETESLAMPLVMGRLLLPEVKLRSSAQSKQLEKRFTYLWQTAHSMAPTSADVAHQLVSSMVAMARQQRVELPSEVVDFVCENCGGLLLPSVTADVRVQPQSHKSAAKRKLSRKRKEAQATPLSIHNVMRISCRRCAHVTIRMGATAPRKPKSKKRPLDEAAMAANAAKRLKTRAASSQLTMEPSSASAPANTTTTIAGPSSQHQPKKAEPTPVVKPLSMFAPAPPPSPPRKLLDGPKKKKKKKKNPLQQPDAATVAVKSSLSAFLSKVPRK